MKIDLHTHTSERSGCAVSTEREQIEAAISYGLDAIVFTDHNILPDPEHIVNLNEKYAPFKIYSGIEIRVKNYKEDFIVMGVHDDALERKSWDYEELHGFVREKNGYLLFCHPYRFHNSVPDAVFEHTPDAVEIHSVNIGASVFERIAELAKLLNVKTVANSDSHFKKHIGMYCNVMREKPQNETELITALKNGNYGFCCDNKRIQEYNIGIGDKRRYLRQLSSEAQ